MIATTKCSVVIHAYGGDYIRNNCLPETGHSVLPFVLAGVLLILVGLGVRWLVRSDA